MRSRPENRLLLFATGVCGFAALVSAVGRGKTTVTFQQGTSGYTGGVDRRIGLTTAAATPTTAAVDGSNAGDTTESQYFIRFNSIFGTGIGQIPAGATILDASLTVKTGSVTNDNSGGYFLFSGMRSDFSTVSAITQLGNGTGAPGSNGPTYANSGATIGVGSLRVPALSTSYTVPIAPGLVQQWADGTLTNNGIVVQAYTTDAWVLTANGNTAVTDRPRLSVTYTTQPTTIASLKQSVAGYTGMTAVTMHGVTGTTTNATSAASMVVDGPTGGTPPGDTGSPDLFGLLKFDGVVGSAADQVPVRATVSKSWLVVTTGNGTADETAGPYSVYRMLTPWTTSSTYSDFGSQGPVAGTHFVATAVGTSATAAQNSQLWIDATSAVTAWKGGAANHGLLVRAGTTDGWAIGSGGNTDATRRPELRTAYSVDSLIWKGSIDAAWDKGTAVGSGGTANWQLQQGATATNFIDTDRVVFDDTAAGSGPVAVTLGGGVSPQRVTFANATRSYTVSGAGGITGAGSLTKQGTGTAILATANTFSGGTTVEAGTLQIGAGGDVGSIAGTIAVQAGATLAINRTGTVVLPGVVSGAGGLSKTGAGKATLSAASTLSGPITVSAGGLAMQATTAPGGVTVADGATFAAASGLTASSFITPSLALGSSGSTLGFELASTGNPLVPLIRVTNTDGFTPAVGSHTLAVTTTGSLGIGRFTLIDYAGGPIGSGFRLAPLPQRLSGSLVYDTVNTTIDLDINGVDVVRWRGDASTAWDAGSAIDVGGTANWRLVSQGTATNFVAGDKLSFDDSADTGSVVLAAGTLAPGEITVDNSSRDYVFSGAGTIGGSGILTKQGTGRLTLLTSVASPGGVAVTGGTLQVGDTNSSPTVSGPTTVASGARLELVGGTVSAVTVQAGGSLAATGGTLGGALTVNGSATVTGGQLAGAVAVNAGTLALGTGGAVVAPTGDIAVAGGATFAFNHANDLTFAAKLTGTGTVTKTGAGRVILNSSSTGYTGTLTIDGGEFRVEDSTGGDLNAVSIVVNAGGTFQFGNNGLGNPDLPNTTFITVNPGGTVVWDEGEDFGGVDLQGGTIDLRAGNINAMSTVTNQQWTSGRLTASGTSAWPFAGANQIVKSSSGTVLVDGKASITSTSALRIEAGTMRFATAGNLGTVTVTLGGASSAGTFRYDGATATRAGSFTLAAGGGEIAVTTAGSELTLSGVLGGSGGPLTVSGPGTVVLTNANTFTGGTNVASGTLRATNGAALGTGGVTIQSGGRLVVGATLSLGIAGITTADGGVLDILSGASAPLAPGSSLAGFRSTFGSSTARILAGSAAASGGDLTATWSGSTAQTVSEVLQLTTPTGGSAFVLSLGYDESLLGGTAEAALRLGWLDENGSSPTFNQWIPAIAGNSANPVALQEPFAGSWDAYWATFTAANPSATLADARGAHGVDAAANTSWAVVDHNSSFAVIPVPEPAETGLVCLGAGWLLVFLRQRRWL